MADESSVQDTIRRLLLAGMDRSSATKTAAMLHEMPTQEVQKVAQEITHMPQQAEGADE